MRAFAFAAAWLLLASLAAQTVQAREATAADEAQLDHWMRQVAGMEDRARALADQLEQMRQAVLQAGDVLAGTLDLLNRARAEQRGLVVLCGETAPAQDRTARLLGTLEAARADLRRQVEMARALSCAGTADLDRHDDALRLAEGHAAAIRQLHQAMQAAAVPVLAVDAAEADRLRDSFNLDRYAGLERETLGPARTEGTAALHRLALLVEQVPSLDATSRDLAAAIRREAAEDGNPLLAPLLDRLAVPPSWPVSPDTLGRLAGGYRQVEGDVDEVLRQLREAAMPAACGDPFTVRQMLDMAADDDARAPFQVSAARQARQSCAARLGR